MKKTTSQLYSADLKDLDVTDEVFDEIKKHGDRIRQYPIYYVDRPGTVDQIRDTILDFMLRDEIKGKWVVIILDHILLTRGKTGEQEREIISDLQRLFMEAKKWGHNSIIQLSQLNRNIENPDRIANQMMHYPNRSDLFGSDSIFHASDLLLVLHRPEILGITDNNYGPNNLPVKNLVYMHILKNREGEPKILVFKNNLKYNSIDELTINK